MFFPLFVATTHMWTSWSIVRWPLTKFMMLGAEHKSPGVVFAVLEWSSKLGWIWEDMPKPTGKWTCIFVWKIFLMLSFQNLPSRKVEQLLEVLSSGWMATLSCFVSFILQNMIDCPKKKANPKDSRISKWDQWDSTCFSVVKSCSNSCGKNHFESRHGKK